MAAAELSFCLITLPALMLISQPLKEIVYTKHDIQAGKKPFEIAIFLIKMTWGSYELCSCNDESVIP